MAMTPSPYSVLGVKKAMTTDEIKKVYRKLASKLHPDNQETGDEAKFKEVQEAWEIIEDPKRRARYDSTGRTDEDKLTDENIREFFESVMKTAIDAPDPATGLFAPVTQENILLKIKEGIRKSRTKIERDIAESKRKMKKAQRLRKQIKRKRSKDEGIDFVSEVLLEQEALHLKDFRTHTDALALVDKSVEILGFYDFEADSKPEGHDSEPASRRLGNGLLISERPRRSDRSQGDQEIIDHFRNSPRKDF